MPRPTAGRGIRFFRLGVEAAGVAVQFSGNHGWAEDDDNRW